MNKNKILKKAYQYITDNGYSVIPVNNNKIPTIKTWREYMKVPPDVTQAAEWWNNTNNNIAILTGSISGITVVDLDRGKADGKETSLEIFPPTFTVKSPSGGYHLYYKHTEKIKQSQNKYPQFPHVDIRNDGGYIVAPPSKITAGGYEIVNDVEIKEFPEHLFKNKSTINKTRQGLDTLNNFKTLQEGDGRNEALTSYANHLLKILPKDKWNIAILSIKGANKEFPVPLPEKEVETITNSMIKRVSGNKKIEWHLDQKGNPYPTTENIYITLNNDPDYSDKFRYNTFTGQVETIFNNKEWVQLLRQDITSVMISLQYKYPAFNSVARGHIEESVIKTAHNTEVSPIAEYIKGLKWDKKPRLELWVTKTYKVEDNAYHAEIGSNWVKALVKRVIFPGTQVDNTLVVDGGQGIGKSRSFRALCNFDIGLLFHETSDTPNNKDFLISLLGNLVIEFSEGAIMNHKDQKKVKSFLTKTFDKYRPPYEKADVEFPRQCVFAMTTNESQFLKDTTGNRRWWSISIPRDENIQIDVEWLKENRDQMLAEAYERIKEPHWELSDEAEKYLKETQEEKTQEDPKTEMILDWYLNILTEKERNNGITATMAYNSLPGQEDKTPNWLDGKIIAELLVNRLHLTYKKIKTEKGTRVMRYMATPNTPTKGEVVTGRSDFENKKFIKDF